VSGELGDGMAFLTGLLGAGHCLGMCSGLAGGAAAHQRWVSWGPVLSYHGVRIALYVALGTLGATLGRTLVQTGSFGKLQGQLLILSGLVILVLGLGMAGLLPWASPSGCPAKGLSSATAVPLQTRAPYLRRLTPALAGLVNGLVPCSLVFSLATRATATMDPVQAALLMLCFGLGTLPVMGSVTALSGRLGTVTRLRGRQLAGGMVILLGAWTLYEGLTFYQVMRGLAD